MGSCVSSESRPSANVVAMSGELRRFPLPITASQVVETLSLSPNSFFLCNSDRLYFDDFIPSLAPTHHLDAAQIYFVLPTSKLQYRLAASDMAALAVKASVALDASNRRRKKKARISPALVALEDPQSNHTVTVNYRKSFDGDDRNKSSAGVRVSRSSSLRKLSRYSSRRAMLAVKSFKMKLATIYEASAVIQST